MQQEACEKVYFARILRGTGSDGFYSTRKLGAFGSDLGAVACFFDQPWSRVSRALTDDDQAWALNFAAYTLRALGRLTEALEPTRAGMEMRVKQESWGNASITTGNLSELELTLGMIDDALADGERILTYTQRSSQWGVHQLYRASYADALHQAGRAEAELRFREAEQMQAERHSDYPLLYSGAGFRYCDLLLTEAERAAWRVSGSDTPRPPEDGYVHRATLRAVVERAAKMFEWRLPSDSLLDIALDYLTLGRAALYVAILAGSSLDPCRAPLQHAVAGLRRAGTQDYLPRGLLTRAWLRFLEGHRTGPDSAQSDLDEAWEIAERGPMKLHIADIRLHRARLFFREAQYHWESPQDDLAAAEKLINDCGYHRRDEELEDARKAIIP